MRKTNWILRWESIHPFYRMEAFFNGHLAKKILGSDYTRLLGICENGVMQMYYDQKDLKEKAEKSMKLMSNRKKITSFIKVTKLNNRSLIESIKTLDVKLRYLSEKEIYVAYHDIISKLEILLASYDLSRPEYFEKIENQIKEILIKTGVKNNQLHKVLTFLVSDTKTNIINKEGIDWLKLVIASKKNKIDVEKELLEHQNKYGWIGTSEQVNPWSLNYYKKLHAHYKKNNLNFLLKELQQKNFQKIKLISEQKKLLKKFRINPKTKYFINLIKMFTSLRLETRLTWVESGFLLENLYKDVACRTKTPVWRLKYYKLEEIKQLLQQDRKVNINTIKERKKAYAFKLHENKLELIIGSKVNNLKKKEIVKISYKNIKQVIGNIANPGQVRGRVKIINALSKNQNKEIIEMKSGLILVTGMTRPHLIHAIKKSSAIVTDEGGIASHAAIVSREFNKPCVVGTKIATKVFKDGDLIEVDANKGIVRKI